VVRIWLNVVRICQTLIFNAFHGSSTAKEKKEKQQHDLEKLGFSAGSLKLLAMAGKP
jgi:hypothetical protein